MQLQQVQYGKKVLGFLHQQMEKCVFPVSTGISSENICLKNISVFCLFDIPTTTSERVEAIRLEEALLLLPFIQGLCPPCYPRVLLTLTLVPRTNKSNEKYIPVLILSFAISGATIQLSSFFPRDQKRQQPEKENATPRIFLLYFRVTLRTIKQNITGITAKE